MDERIPGVLRKVADLDIQGPDASTVDAISDGTGYEVQDVKNLMAEAHVEKLADFDNVRHVWILTTKGLESIETV
jgi:hypothetical protein